MITLPPVGGICASDIDQVYKYNASDGNLLERIVAAYKEKGIACSLPLRLGTAP